MIVMWKSSLHLFWINCPEENKQEKDLEGIRGVLESDRSMTTIFHNGRVLAIKSIDKNEAEKQ